MSVSLAEPLVLVGATRRWSDENDSKGVNLPKGYEQDGAQSSYSKLIYANIREGRSVTRSL